MTVELEAGAVQEVVIHTDNGQRHRLSLNCDKSHADGLDVGKFFKNIHEAQLYFQRYL